MKRSCCCSFPSILTNPLFTFFFPLLSFLFFFRNKLTTGSFLSFFFFIYPCGIQTHSSSSNSKLRWEIFLCLVICTVVSAFFCILYSSWVGGTHSTLTMYPASSYWCIYAYICSCHVSYIYLFSCDVEYTPCFVCWLKKKSNSKCVKLSCMKIAHHFCFFKEKMEFLYS